MGDCQSCLENTKDSITSSTSSIKDILVPSQNSENISSIMSSAPTFGPPKLKPVYHLEINFAPPVIIPNGPLGTRALIHILDGKFHGYEGFEDFHGEIVAPSSDLTMVHADGSGITLNVNFTMKLHDGKIMLGKVTGKSERDQDNPANARVHSCKSFEVGNDPRYKWMNSQVFVGYGRKEGSNIKLDYYQVID